MTAPRGAPAVRRSAIEASHAALGARWVAEDVHWPAWYGVPGASDAAASADAAATADGVPDGAGLAEIGPLDELLLRGPGALAAAAGLTPGKGAVTDGHETVGRAVAADLRGDAGSAWFLGPDEVLLLAPVGGSGLPALAAELASDDVSAIEMTGARTSLRLAGPTAPAILAELCPADTTPATMAAGDLVQAPLAGVRAFIVRADSGAHPGYTIMVARDEATYVWDALRHVGEAHGMTPVGPAAVAPEVAP